MVLRSSCSAAIVLALFGCAPQADRVGSGPRGAGLVEDVVEVRGGRFRMGCVEGDTACEEDELPAHKVWLPPYAIDRYEATWDEYAACVEDGECTKVYTARCYTWIPERGFAQGIPLPAELLGADQPVVCVTWQQARDFCRWRGGELPSESQWEYAARGEQRTLYPWGNEPPTCERAHMHGCTDATRPVGTAPAGASPWGVHDLAGNAWEWVADWWDDDEYRRPRHTYVPHGPIEGEVRVVRGGSIYDDDANLRISYRYGLSPEYGYSIVGFRCRQ